MRFLFIVVLILASGRAAAQAPLDSTRLDTYYLDFSVPDLGAFTLLGTKPENTTNPGSPKELAGSVLNAVQSRDQITPGVAVDWAPLQTFRKTQSPADYRKWVLLRKLQLSYGTVADSVGTRIGAGVKWTLLDRSDPLLDRQYEQHIHSLMDASWNARLQAVTEFNIARAAFADAVRQHRSLPAGDPLEIAVLVAVSTIYDPANPAYATRDAAANYQDARQVAGAVLSAGGHAALRPDEEVWLGQLASQMEDLDARETAYLEAYAREFKRLQKDWMNRHWNAAVLVIGAGWVWGSPDNTWKSLATSVFKGYINGRLPVGRRAQVTGILSCFIPGTTELVPSDSATQAGYFAGGRFLIGNATHRFSIDLGYGRTVARQIQYSTDNLIANLAVEFKVTDGLFFELAGGFQGPRDDFSDQARILGLGSLKYAFGQKQRFAVPD